MTNAHPRREATRTELVASVARFLETHVLPAAAADRHSYEEIYAAVESLRIVERELLAEPAGPAGGAAVREALAKLGFTEEAQLSAAIRNGDLDDRAEDVTSCLRAMAKHRLAVAHPGYQDE